MKSFFVKTSWLGLASIILAVPVFGQNYPMPSATPVPCTTVGCYPAPGLPTYPYSAPVLRHVGRYLDSTQVRDIQWPIRTLRARRTAIVPERDRVYMRIGSTFAVYRLSTFFSSDLGKPLSSVKAGTRPVPEQYLGFFDSVYPETDPNWKTGTADGQDRLGEGFDWDDRGYLYLPYKIYGWGIYRDTTRLEFVKQYHSDANLSLTAASIISVKDGAKYYAIVADDSLTSLVLDVTDPMNAVRVGTLSMPIGQFAKVQLNGKQVIAIVTGGEIRIYSPNALITGAAPEKVIQKSSGGNITSVTSDGTRFFGAEYTGTGTNVITIAATGTAVETFLATRTPVTGVRTVPQRITYSSGSLAISGGSMRGLEVYLFRVAGDSLQQVDLGNFFNAYYTGWWVNGVQTHASPGQCYVADTAILYKEGGKEYLLVGMTGLGDVFQLQASNGVSIDWDRNSFGTANPYSAGTGGPFYGDVFSFTTSSTTNTPVSIGVNFGNPEAGSVNTPTANTGTALSYRYSGLTSAAAIQQARQVKITASADASMNAETSLSMSVPVARIGVKDTSLLFIQPNASATAPLLVGQQFVDASDGSVESHYASWVLDGVETKLLPNQPLDVGQCSATPHTLALTSRYGYYDSSFTQRNNPDFNPANVGLTYVVRPFVSRIAVVASDGAGVTYKATSTPGAGAIVGGSAAAATFRWELLDSAGATIRSSDLVATLATEPTFTLASSELVAGNKVKLTVSIDPALIAAGCQLAGMEAAGETVVLKVPDPSISLDAGKCQYAGKPCSVTATSASSQDQSLWTYSWYLNGSGSPALTGTGPAFASFSPTVSEVGNYSVRVAVRNEAGITASSSTVTFPVVTPPCNGKPTDDIYFMFYGVNSKCSGDNKCTAAEEIHFEAKGWSYQFQTCDSFSWNFGDNGTSSLQSPNHKFASNGSYTVKLTVTNDAGSYTYSKVVKLGTVQDPDPQPTCLAPSQMIGFSFTGASSGCTTLPSGPSCKTGESIAFRAQNYPSPVWQSCDRFSWSFGDGGSSTAQNPQKAYTTPGTYRVSLTVSNSSGSATTALDVVVAQGTGGGDPNPGDPSCSRPSDLSYVVYQGLSSGCTSSNNNPCNPGETIRLTATMWQGVFQACDRFDWNFGDGTAPVTNQTSKTIDHVFSGAQLEYTVGLTIRNAAGSVAVGEKVKFAGEPIAKPTSVDFSFSGTTAVVGSPVTFTATANAPEGHPVTTWKWDIEEGPTLYGNPVQHTFSTEGTWNVTLTASNGGGPAAPVTKQVRVLKANAFTYLLPVVSHLNGANGSQWRTDLQIYNSNVGEGPVELEFELTNKSLKKTFTLNTSTLILEDFMAFFNNGEWAGDWVNGWAGPVIVRGAATHDLQIWTRTYSVGASGIGTYGHLIPAIRIDGDQGYTSGETNLYMTGVSATSKYRTNIYLLNLTSQSMPVTITAYEGGMGAAVGQLTQEVAPFQLTPISATQIAGAPTDKPFSIAIKGTSNGLIAYESVVDNGSNDPIYLPAIGTTDLGDAAMKNQVVPSIGHFQTWRSDVTVFNPDDQAVQFDLAFYDSTGALKAEAKDKILPAKGLLQLEDILRSDAMSIPEDVIGTLRLSVDSPLADQYPIVAQRNYSDAGDQRRFGQGILGFAEANVQTGKPAIIPAVRNDQLYKSNVGLVNVGATDATIQLTLLDQSTGQPVGIFSVTLKPNESRILPEAIPNVFLSSTDRGSIKVEVTNDASVWAFAAIIDRSTSDPEYVPAIQLD